MFRRAQTLNQASKGLFDPGVCALVKLWQFDTEEDLATAKGPPPVSKLALLRAQQGSVADLRIEGGTVSADKPLCVDLGGMAKGSALMQAREILQRHGISSAFIDIGGSSQLAIGHHLADRRDPASRSWQIGLRDPRANHLLARLRLASGEAASTSGDYERAYVENGHRYHHILDPRSGRPTDGAASVTVLAEDAELADAASTALMVAGPDRFRELCAALSIRDALLITTDGEWLATATMAERLRRDNPGRTIPLPTALPLEGAPAAAGPAKL
ncbi:MAG: FAD:protein FMN transferase [Gammaproteobacteria bacterium]